MCALASSRASVDSGACTAAMTSGQPWNPSDVSISACTCSTSRSFALRIVLLGRALLYGQAYLLAAALERFGNQRVFRSKQVVDGGLGQARAIGDTIGGDGVQPLAIEELASRIHESSRGSTDTGS